MDYVNVSYSEPIAETLAALKNPGALLVTADHNGFCNVMTIGWGTIGTIWGKPIFMVLVRPSRFSYQLLEEGSAFTVCLPSPDMQQAVEYCGKMSGRSHDKFQDLNLTKLPSSQINVPGIAGCPVIYECQTVHTNDILADRLAASIQERAYPKGDYHRLYFGEILATRRLQGES